VWGNEVWWAGLEIQRARELVWERAHRHPTSSPGPMRIKRKLMRLVQRARREGLSPAEIEGIVRWALKT